MYRIGFSTIGCPDYSISAIIAMALREGYQGVEFRFLCGTVDLLSRDEFSPAHIAATACQFADAGIAVVCVGTSVRMVSLDPAMHAAQMETARRHANIAAALGAPFIRVFGGPLPPDQDRERTLDAIAKGLSEVAQMTEALGVTTLIETHDAFCLCTSINELYARGMDDRVGVLWDTLHSWRHGESAHDSWIALGPRIRLVHIKDAQTATAAGFDFALTGEGVLPIGGFLDLLEQQGYSGYVNFEWEKGWHPEIPGPEVALPHFAGYMAARAGART